MPRLILEARRVAATVIHGLHGRRRAGTGENFWQFRRFVSGEPAGRVDWRRSARDDHLYVREQEWEAAHTVWIWPDRSPSMVFASPLVWETKLDRALVVAFALAEVLVEGGERVGIPGLMRPSASRNIIEKMAEIIVHDPTERGSLPPSFAPSPQSEIVVLSDLWSPIARRAHAPSRNCRRTARTATWCRSSIRRRRPSRSPAASSSSIPRTATRSRSAAPKPGATNISSGSSAIAPRSAPRPTGSAGASSSTAPTGPRPNCCSAAHADGRGAERHRHQPLARGSASPESAA